MLSNWIKPSSINEVIKSQHTSRIFADQILPYSDNIPINPGDLCLLGIGKQAEGIREFLYNYSPINAKIKLIDLGDIRKRNAHVLIPVLKELKDAEAHVIIIDAEGIGPTILFEHYNDVNQIFDPVIVDEFLRVNDSSFDVSVLNKDLFSCLNINVIGSQMHLNKEVLDEENYKIKHLRLGQIRQSKSKIEPIIRNADFCYFNLNGVRKSDAPGKTGTNPSGLYAEEASQISRYAGLSEDLSAFMIGGFWHVESQTAELISQMIWYFIDGFSKRIKDKIENNKELQEYVVTLSEPNMSLTFLKSEKSGRWWFKVGTQVNEQEVFKHIPCTYQDYQQACNDEISEWMLETIENH